MVTNIITGIIIIAVVVLAFVGGKYKVDLSNLYKELDKEEKTIKLYVMDQIKKISSIYGAESFEDFQAMAIQKLIVAVYPYIVEDLVDKSERYPAIKKIINSKFLAMINLKECITKHVLLILTSNEELMNCLEEKYDYIMKEINEIASDSDK